MEALKEVKAVVMDKTGTITKGNFEVQKCIPVGAWKEEELLAVAAGCESTSTSDWEQYCGGSKNVL